MRGAGLKERGPKADGVSMEQSTPATRTPTTNAATHAGQRTGKYTNTALTAVALLLGLNLLKPGDFAATAMAQPGEGQQTLASAAEQRKQMIGQLSSLEKKLDKIDAMLTKGIKITDMPELKLPSELKDAVRAAAKHDSKTDKQDRPVEGAPR